MNDRFHLSLYFDLRGHFSFLKVHALVRGEAKINRNQPGASITAFANAGVKSFIAIFFAHISR